MCFPHDVVFNVHPQLFVCGGWGQERNVGLASFCRSQQFLVVLLAGHDVSLQLVTVCHHEHLGLLAVLQELVEVGLQVAQDLLVLTG